MENAFSLPWVAGPLDQLNTFFKGGSPKAPPQPDPPVTERRTEVVAAERQARIDAKKRKGQMASVFAGETGGYQALDDGQGQGGLLG
jgi:hypothetical protein